MPVSKDAALMLQAKGGRPDGKEKGTIKEKGTSKEKIAAKEKGRSKIYR
jgi:hypothetical protein